MLLPIGPNRTPNWGQLAVRLATATAILIVLSLAWRMEVHFDDHVDVNMDSTSLALLRTENEAPRLGQVLRNLVSNALAVSEAGVVSVEVEVIEVHEGQMVLELRVSDSGPGIPEEDQQRIFGESAVVDPGYDRSFGGTGLSLAVCGRIVEDQRGEIGVVSVPGEGSCFWFRLTLHHVAAAVRRFDPRPDTPKAASAPRPGLEWSLLITDGLLMRRCHGNAVGRIFG